MAKAETPIRTVDRRTAEFKFDELIVDAFAKLCWQLGRSPGATLRAIVNGLVSDPDMCNFNNRIDLILKIAAHDRALHDAGFSDSGPSPPFLITKLVRAASALPVDDLANVTRLVAHYSTGR